MQKLNNHQKPLARICLANFGHVDPCSHDGSWTILDTRDADVSWALSSCTAQSSSIFDQLIALHVYHLLGTAEPGAWRRLEKYGRQRCDNAVTFLYSYV